LSLSSEELRESVNRAQEALSADFEKSGRATVEQLLRRAAKELEESSTEQAGRVGFSQDLQVSIRVGEEHVRARPPEEVCIKMDDWYLCCLWPV
jgi:hypothetical protein